MKNQQNVEVEYKFLIEDKPAMLAKLDILGKRTKERQYQSNVMFDNPQGLMKVTDGRVRVRMLGDTGDKVLTYKKPLPPENGAKREVEYEIKFSDAKSQIENILNAMDFTPTTSYERFQTKWQIGDAQVTVDEYPYANFVEIEGERVEIEEIANKLGFDVKQGLTKPVDTLFTEWRKGKGLPFKPHMRFDDFDK